MPYLEYKIHVIEREVREIAIALLSDLGVWGFEETETELIAPVSTELDSGLIKDKIQFLRLSYSVSELPDENWNAIWEANFQPVSVYDRGGTDVFAYVRAHFHEAPNHALHDLIITPKMSFGTGHHATTYGVMSYMSNINLLGLSVVDFGTGTGLLSILAEKMGASSVLAIDNDPWCIRNAEENVLANGCKNICLRMADRFESLEPSDVILANINLNIIKANLSLISNSCHSETILVFSGILAEDELNILSALHTHNIIETRVLKNDNWLIIAAKPGR